MKNGANRIEFTPLAWRHLIIQVPRHWEVIGHSKNPRDGQIALADRKGETLQFHWQLVKTPPAVNHLLVSLINLQPRDSQPADAPESQVRRNIAEINDWRVYFPARNHPIPVFALRYLQEQRTLINLTFIRHPDTDHDLIRQILESYAPNHGDERAWAAFGLNFTLPKEMELDHITALPAGQIMEFENRREEFVHIHRYGMLDAILAEDDMSEFFARVKGRKYLLRRRGEFLKDDKYPGIILEYTTRGRGGLGALIARTWQGRVYIWRCDDIQRLYCVDHNALEKNLIPDLPDRVVSQ